MKRKGDDMKKARTADTKLTTKRDIVSALLIRRARTGISAVASADAILRKDLRRELAELARDAKAEA